MTVPTYSDEEAIASSYRMLKEIRPGRLDQSKNYPKVCLIELSSLISETLFGASSKLCCHSGKSARCPIDEYGNKIICPPSMLEKIDYDQIEVPVDSLS